MKKQHIISIVLVVLLLLGVGYKWYESNNPEIVATAQTEASTSTSSSLLSDVTAPARASVDIQTERPINGTLKGVIEVGASGFNSFVINVDKDKNWELVSKEFGESLAYEGFATTDDVKLGLKKYLAAMFEKGVSGRNAHFVMSSGALKNPKTELIAKAIEQMGYVVNRVTADQEGKYALKALLPKNYRDNSFVVDMGSGNTKISWYSNGKIQSVEAPGAKYYQNGVKDADVYNQITAAVGKVPAQLKQNCFIIGGVPFKLAKEVRNAEERFTVLDAADEYSAGDDVKIKSGLNIYRALEDATNAENFIFDWDANFTIGFLLTLN